MANAASASPTVALNPLSNLSITLAVPGSAEMRKTFSLPGGKGRKNSHTSCGTEVPKANAAMIARSTREEIRPLGKPRTRAANTGVHQFADHWPSV
jgi:hypothetical protein